MIHAMLCLFNRSGLSFQQNLWFLRPHNFVEPYPSALDIMQKSSWQHSCHQIAFLHFLNCSIGIEGLRYNHASNKFIRPTGIPVSGSVSHELIIDVFEE
jgi:hypothetical protein